MSSLTDFNDLHRVAGLAEVRRQIYAALNSPVVNAGVGRFRGCIMSERVAKLVDNLIEIDANLSVCNGRLMVDTKMCLFSASLLSEVRRNKKYLLALMAVCEDACKGLDLHPWDLLRAVERFWLGDYLNDRITVDLFRLAARALAERKIKMGLS